jgi:hypothetical protein
VSGGLTKFGAYAIHDWLWVQRRFSAQSTERRVDFAIPQEREWRLPKGGDVDFVMFEDVDGMEVFVNPERVIWVREYPGQTTVISCGDEDKFAVRLSPAQTVAALGKAVR